MPRLTQKFRLMTMLGSFSLSGKHCGTTRARPADNPCAVYAPGKMARPFLYAGIKQEEHALTDRVAIVGAYPFVEIATRTRIGEILKRRCTTLYLWLNMLDLQRAADNALCTLAIFAAIASALGDLLAKFRRNIRHIF